MSHHHGNTDTQGSGAEKGTGCKSLTARGEGRAAKGNHGGDRERSVTTEWSLQIQMYIGKGSSWREAHTIAFRGDGAIFLKKRLHRDFPSGSGVENLPFNAGDTGWIPGWRTKTPHAMGKISQHATILCPRAATKTR